MRLILALALTIFATPSVAYVEISFRDGNPLDVFTISRVGCAFGPADLHINMATSQGGALIDTEYGGPGTQDPSPVTLENGKAILAPVTDGDQVLNIAIDWLSEDDPIRITLDMDDSVSMTRGPRVMVEGREMLGATATLTMNGQATTGVFDGEGVATLAPDNLEDCQLLS